MLKLILVKIIFYALIISCFSCEGPEGPIGPQGDPGEQGDPGTANVIYSEWLNLTFTEGIYGGYYADINTEHINQDVFDKGEIAVYFGNEHNVNKLPYYYSASYHLRFTLRHGTIEIYSATSPDASFRFRYVIIPGGTAANGRVQGVDLSSYQEVISTYNISE